MIRGTTPSIRISIKNLDISTVDTFYLTIKQSLAGVTIEKSLDDVIVDEEPGTFLVKLTQDDTLKLQNGKAEMQVRVKDNVGNAVATNVVTFDVGKILKGGVI